MVRNCFTKLGLIWLCIAAALSGSALAANLSVVVRDENGKTVADAVVTLSPAPEAGQAIKLPQERHHDAPYEIVQKNLKFIPHILVVPQGASVSFPNHDDVRHHVYSFSPARRFELTLYGNGESRVVKFDKPGVVAIGCNIHDDMKAYLFVYKSSELAKLSGRDGAVFDDIPGGRYRVSVWHPRLKAKDETVEKIVQIPAKSSQTEKVDVSLRPARRPVRTLYH